MGFSVGPLEVATLAVIALLVLGPQKLPEAARAVGKGIREMRAALSADSDEDEAPERLSQADRLPEAERPPEPDPR